MCHGKSAFCQDVIFKSIFYIRRSCRCLQYKIALLHISMQPNCFSVFYLTIALLFTMYFIWFAATALWPLVGGPCPADLVYCLNGGTCTFYETIGELVCQWVEYNVIQYSTYYFIYIVKYIICIHFPYSVIL